MQSHSTQNDGSSTDEKSVVSDPVSLAATEATNRIAGLFPDIAPSLRDDIHGIIQEEFADMGMDLYEAHKSIKAAQDIANAMGAFWKDYADRAEARVKFLTDHSLSEPLS